MEEDGKTVKKELPIFEVKATDDGLTVEGINWGADYEWEVSAERNDDGERQRECNHKRGAPVAVSISTRWTQAPLKAETRAVPKNMQPESVSAIPCNCSS